MVVIDIYAFILQLKSRKKYDSLKNMLNAIAYCASRKIARINMSQFTPFIPFYSFLFYSIPRYDFDELWLTFSIFCFFPEGVRGHQ